MEIVRILGLETEFYLHASMNNDQVIEHLERIGNAGGSS